MQPKESSLFEIHGDNTFIKLFPSGIEVANTSESITYIPLSYTEMLKFANEIIKNIKAALAARAIAELKETKPAELKSLLPLFDMMDADTIANIYYGKLDEFVSPETKNRLVIAINNQISAIEEREKDEYNAFLSA
nr:MAG TPA: hypothetical protein [Caudoviricetes sp.]